MELLTKRNLAVAGVALGAPALALAWWLGSPLFLDTEVDEEFPLTASAEVPEDMTREEVEREMAKAAAAPSVEEREPMPETAAAPQVLAAGEFRDADPSHRGSGTATIYRLEDGSHILRLESFEVTNGPDLHVLLAAGDGSGEDGLGDYVDLGSLKGNIGDQNYEIPDDVDVSAYGTVVIYCVPFHVVFSVAPLG